MTKNLIEELYETYKSYSPPSIDLTEVEDTKEVNEDETDIEVPAEDEKTEETANSTKSADSEVDTSPYNKNEGTTSMDEVEKSTDEVKKTEIVPEVVEEVEEAVKTVETTETATKEAVPEIEAPSPDPTPASNEIVTEVKAVSVAAELDTYEDLNWELCEVWWAFQDACCKLMIAAEVNETDPDMSQLNALCDELAALLKQVFADDSSQKSISLLLIKSLIGRASKITPSVDALMKSVIDNTDEIEQRLSVLGDAVAAKEAELNGKVKELEEVTVRQEELTRLDAAIAEKNKELEEAVEKVKRFEEKANEPVTTTPSTPEFKSITAMSNDEIVKRFLRP